MSGIPKGDGHSVDGQLYPWAFDYPGAQIAVGYCGVHGVVVLEREVIAGHLFRDFIDSLASGCYGVCSAVQINDSPIGVTIGATCIGVVSRLIIP